MSPGIGEKTGCNSGSVLFRQTLRVPFADTDASTRTHFSALLRWVEASEHELLREVAPLLVTDFPRVHVTCQYLLPIRFGDVIDVVLTDLSIGRTSIKYVWEVRRTEEKCASAEITAVLVNASGAPQPIPDEIRNWLSARRSGPGYSEDPSPVADET